MTTRTQGRRARGPRSKPARRNTIEVPEFVAPYLATLRRIPNEIVLSVGSRDMDMGDPMTCLCGWALREGLANMAKLADAERVSHYIPSVWPSSYPSNGVPDKCARLFAGDWLEWNAVFMGVTDERAPLIETAFAIRVAECA